MHTLQLTPADCAVPGCVRKAVTRGWCHGHYPPASRTGDVQADVPAALGQRVQDELAFAHTLLGSTTPVRCSRSPFN